MSEVWWSWENVLNKVMEWFLCLKSKIVCFKYFWESWLEFVSKVIYLSEELVLIERDGDIRI